MTLEELDRSLIFLPNSSLDFANGFWDSMQTAGISNSTRTLQLAVSIHWWNLPFTNIVQASQPGCEELCFQGILA